MASIVSGSVPMYIVSRPKIDQSRACRSTVTACLLRRLVERYADSSNSSLLHQGAPMSTPERRHFPRTTMEKLAPIQIEPNNGGIVLNVSGEGLCFHSIAAVEKNGPLRFSLVEQNRRIAASGELAWTDKLQQVGGVRFTTLTAAAREQIQNWISQPAAPLEEHETATLGSAPLKAFPRLPAHRSDVIADSGNSSAFAAALKKRLRIKISGFARGLVTGLLISALGASVFLLYAHRRDIGESLIHLGERLAAKPEAETQPAAVRAQPAAGAQRPVRGQTPVRMHTSLTPARPQIPVERPNKLLAQPLTSPAKQEQPTPQPALPTDVPAHAANSPVPQHPAVRDSADPTAPTPSQAVPSSPIANVIPNKLSALAQPAPASPVQVSSFSEATAVSLPQMYFELGKFKDERWAHNLSDKVAQLGLRSRVIQKGHLWMSSFYVLVGPYGNQEEATRTQKDLVSHGYKPRPFERGSRSFRFISALTLEGARLPVGDFTITWESHVTDAKVKFAQGGDVLATADGQWVNRPRRYQNDEYVYVESSNGSRLLREIHFSGLDRTLVFRNSS
jgi:cell division protein FtsN